MWYIYTMEYYSPKKEQNRALCRDMNYFLGLYKGWLQLRLAFLVCIKDGYHWGLPGGSDSKESACNAGDLGSISGSGRSPGEKNGYPLQYSCLENPWAEEPGRLQSMVLQRVGHNWATNTHTQPWSKQKIGFDNVTNDNTPSDQC